MESAERTHLGGGVEEGGGRRGFRGDGGRRGSGVPPWLRSPAVADVRELLRPPVEPAALGL